MYNGIGLQTPRGSGTNGYVQRNLAFVKPKKDKIDYKSEEELNKLDQSLNKQPNKEILDHERKRKVELKCMEMQELMEEQGYSEKEVRDKVNMFRKMLMAKEGVSETTTVDRDEHGRPIARETHQLAEANQEKNARLKEAFGLTDYVEGSAFDPDRKAKEEAAKAAALAQKKYSVVHSSDEEGKEEGTSPQKKKKKRSRHDSTSSERSKDKKKKSRKHSRRDRLHLNPFCHFFLFFTALNKRN
ncbi:Serine/arginine repetitive matrix protein 2 [Bulinus truncatus]|nr:Serine/arginine repetitive matrix protein 2 [Bulinus truncatus]